MKTEYQTIIKPIITEETMDLASDKKYVFQVAKEANKTEVRQAEDLRRERCESQHYECKR